MGYSITQEQHERLERNRAEGRLCWVATGRGGCFNRATVRQSTESWAYGRDKDAGLPPEHNTHVCCARHARQTPVGFEGENFRVVSSERF